VHDLQAAAGLGVEVGWYQDGWLGAAVGDHADQAAGLTLPGQFDLRVLSAFRSEGASVAYRVGDQFGCDDHSVLDQRVQVPAMQCCRGETTGCPG
jgi:hypothetical protein